MTELLTEKKLFTKIMTAAILLAIVASLCSFAGSRHISPAKILDKDTLDHQIFFQIRLPRIILAAIVGAALACAGVVFQGLLRNPLADPYILGVSSGAGLGVTIAVISGLSWSVYGRTPISACAFLGSIGTIWLVWLISRPAGRSSPTHLLLAGVIVNALFSAVIMFLVSIIKSQQVHSTIFWLMGNIAEEQPLILWLCGGLVTAAIIGVYFLSPQLNAISFGQSDAKTMGIDTEKTQAAAFAMAAAMTAIAVSLSGLIGFVGLVIPHAIRMLFGSDHRQLVPLSAITGAAFLIVADTAARIVVAPAQLPVGVITAIIGGPFFLILLIRNSRTLGWNMK